MEGIATNIPFLKILLHFPLHTLVYICTRKLIYIEEICISLQNHCYSWQMCRIKICVFCLAKINCVWWELIAWQDLEHLHHFGAMSRKSNKMSIIVRVYIFSFARDEIIKRFWSFFARDLFAEFSSGISDNVYLTWESQQRSI